MSNAVGPVCHIPPKNQTGNPQPQNMPGLPGPANVNDLQGIVNLLNALRLALQALLNQNNKNNKQPPGVINDFFTKQDANWVEVSRVTETVRVFQNNDPTSPNWIDVKQINQLKMGNKKSGETWVWNRGK